jgi:hypothetical protein
MRRMVTRFTPLVEPSPTVAGDFLISSDRSEGVVVLVPRDRGPVACFGRGRRSSAAGSRAIAPDAPPLAPPPARSAPPPAPGRTLPLVELEQYPEALVDRPLTLLAGMTEVSAAYDLASTTGKPLSHRTPDLAASHSFGSFELAADLGQNATLSVTIPTGGFPAAIVIGADSGAPQQDDSLHEGQFVDLEHKLYVAPGACALFFAAGASYNENRIVDTSTELVWTHVIVASGDAELELQLLPTLALDIGVSAEWAVESSQQLDRTWFINGGASLIATLSHSWDVYANAGLSDLETNRLPYLAFGFAKRWGG